MSVVPPTTKAALKAVLASIGAAITALPAADYGDGQTPTWTLSRGVLSAADMAAQPLEVTLTLRGGPFGRPAAALSIAHDLVVGWSVRYRKDRPLDDQAALLASVLAAAGALRAWGDEASGARLSVAGYTVSAVDGAPGWLRVELQTTLHLPWRA